MSSSIRSMFDSLAHRYDFLNHFLSMGRDLVWRRKSSRMVAPLHPGRLLDLCGGTGDFLIAWTESTLGMQPQPVLGDFSFAMLRLGQAKVRRLGVRACCVQLDALHPPFKAGTFGAVTCGFGMRNLDSTPEGIRQVARLLQPGGCFLTLEFFRPESGFQKLFYGRLAPLLFPLFGALLVGDAKAYRYLADSVRAYIPVKEYARLLSISGFSGIGIKSWDGGIAHAVKARISGLDR